MQNPTWMQIIKEVCLKLINKCTRFTLNKYIIPALVWLVPKPVCYVVAVQCQHALHRLIFTNVNIVISESKVLYPNGKKTEDQCIAIFVTHKRNNDKYRY